MRSSLILLALLASPTVAADRSLAPASAIEAAYKDCIGLPPNIAPHVRYLSLYNLPEKDRADAARVLAFHCNSLSAEADIVLPAIVPDTAGALLRVNILDYGWKASTWEKLAEVDPYFHVRLESEEDEIIQREYGYNDANGKWVKTRVVPEKSGKKIKKVQINASAPWLAETEAQQTMLRKLLAFTTSQGPVVRGDWFLAQTAVQKDRDGHGYYDFLGLGKKQADFDELVGFDAKLAAKFKAELAGVVLRSTVALNNRRLIRFGKIGGAKWITLDAKNNVDRRNFARVLDDGFEFDATEQIASLPNGLHAFWLADSAGARQDTAPDFIASDGLASGTDRRVHAGRSCIVCHAEGIRPIDDWVRRLVAPPLSLQSPDYDKLRRLRRLYLSDLKGAIEGDNLAYGKAIAACNGLTISKNAQAYGRFWDRYVETDLDLARVGRDLGVDSDRVIPAFKAYVSKTGSIDPILAGLLQDPPLAIRHEQWEEVFASAMLAVRGYVAAP